MRLGSTTELLARLLLKYTASTESHSVGMHLDMDVDLGVGHQLGDNGLLQRVPDDCRDLSGAPVRPALLPPLAWMQQLQVKPRVSARLEMTSMHDLHRTTI